MVSRLVVPLAFLFSIFLVFSDWVKGPISLLAQSSGGSSGEGLQFHIFNVRIDDARRSVVTGKITTDTDSPLSLADLDEFPRFTIARLKIDEETGLLSEWANYIIATVPGQPYSKDGVEVQPAWLVHLRPP